MIYDVLINHDQAKAETLYNFLKTAKCSNLSGSNLSMTCQYLRSPLKAYRIQVDGKNKYKYMYSLSEYETMETPIELDKFMERTVKI